MRCPASSLTSPLATISFALLVFAKSPNRSRVPFHPLLAFPINMITKLFMGTPAAGADTIATEAEATTNLLDKAVSQVRCYRALDVAKHLEELANIRGLVQKIRYQEDLQTRPVATALAALKGIVEKLAQVLEASSGALQQLANIMDEVRQAGQNLRQRLPGDVAVVLNNETNGGFQGNAAIGGARPDGRVITEAVGNKCTDATQVNAPMYGDPAALAQFMAAAMQAGAKR